jgi:hypothetical protein
MTKITVFRFMSEEEFTLYGRGELVQGKPQIAYNLSSAYRKAVGCFMPVETWWKDDPAGAAKSAYQYLAGIVSKDVCAIFSAPADTFHQGNATYADPYGSFLDTMMVDELMTPSYSKETFELISCYRNFDDDWF